VPASAGTNCAKLPVPCFSLLSFAGGAEEALDEDGDFEEEEYKSDGGCFLCVPLVETESIPLQFLRFKCAVPVLDKVSRCVN